MEARGGTPPGPDARHLTIDWGKGRLRWERHTEFTKWTFDAPAAPHLGDPLSGHPFGDVFAPPGPVIAAARLDLLAGEARAEALAFFDPTSLCLSSVDGGLAEAASDFRQDADGLTRIAVLDHGLGPARAGALTQRLLEIETYRTLALLGLPEAQRLAPELGHIEGELSRITVALQKGTVASRALLDELIALSAELEAGAVATLSRFGASRAYEEIVNQRLAVLNEMPISGYEIWKSFLLRRMGPAMRNCQTVQSRQESTLAEAGARRRSPEDAGRRGAGAAEPRPAHLDGPPRQAAAPPAADCGRASPSRRSAITSSGLVSYVAHGFEDAGVAVSPPYRGRGRRSRGAPRRRPDRPPHPQPQGLAVRQN